MLFFTAVGIVLSTASYMEVNLNTRGEGTVVIPVKSFPQPPNLTFFSIHADQILSYVLSEEAKNKIFTHLSAHTPSSKIPTTVTREKTKPHCSASSPFHGLSVVDRDNHTRG